MSPRARRRSARIQSPDGVLALVLAAGAGLRMWMMLAAGPGFLGYPDAASYVQIAAWSGTRGLFANPWRPAGFPLFLSALHAVAASLTFAIVVQHLMGLLVAAMLYRALAGVVRNRWVALLPAVVVAFGGTEIYLEHAALSETLYTTLVVGALWCGTRSVSSTGAREAGWLWAAGILTGMSATVRAIGICAVPVFLVWVLGTRHGWRGRVRCVTFLALGLAIPLVSYLATQHRVTGTWGLTRTTGQTLYARAAIFADCRDFTPPAGTRRLCQPPGTPREGATWYMFASASPEVRTMGAPPTDPRPGVSLAWPADARLKSFALRAMAHQPGALLSTTLQGLADYVVPGIGEPQMLEWSAPTLITELRDPTVSRSAVRAVRAYYPDARMAPSGLGALDAYADDASVEGIVTGLLLVLVLGCVALRGRRGAVALLFAGMTAAMMVVPVVLLFYGARYATPSYGPLAATAALGLDGILGGLAVADCSRPRLLSGWRRHRQSIRGADSDQRT